MAQPERLLILVARLASAPGWQDVTAKLNAEGMIYFQIAYFQHAENRVAYHYPGAEANRATKINNRSG